ncbi:MAG: amino acid ABC transporter substrate-binding protein [Deltaproteobacteria bacterium]|nr:amino acid ABC transporter substrate-binding protein [Deltaproteobacteria bacterium]
MKYFKLAVCTLVLISFIGFPLIASSAPKAKDKIVVGMSRPLSGWMAQIGDSAFRPVYETWVKEVNAQGGIFVKEYNKKLPIELKIYDDKSDVGTMTRLTEKLILQDKVDFLWPACGTAFLFAQAPIANKYNKLLISMEGGATSIKDMLPSLPYLFISLSFSDWNQIPVLADLLADKGAKTAYLISMADLFGIEYSGVCGIELPKKGISIVGMKSVPPDIKDLSSILKEAQASKADALLVLGYPDVIILATKQSMELGYNPKVMLGGPGINFGFYHAIFGPATEGVMGFTMAAPKTSPAMKALFEKLYKGKPEAIHDYWGHPLYWAALECWKQAIEKAGTLDNKKIREVMATTTFNTVLGPTRFVKGLLDKESHTGEIGQWQKGVYEVVGPKNKATAPMLYPKPNWPAPAPAKK